MNTGRIDAKFRRIEAWKSNCAIGWAEPEVVGRFEAGARGQKQVFSGYRLRQNRAAVHATFWQSESGLGVICDLHGQRLH